MSRASPDPITLAVLAKAPVAGFAKTRLIQVLGAHAAAILQERLTERAVTAACEASVGRVVLWCAPDGTHPSFRALAGRHPLTLARQPEADLGTRMLTAIADARGPALVIGTDCPTLTAEHLCSAAAVLAEHDVVVIPADDGGYVLIGMGAAHAELFSGIAWGTATVMAETRRRIAQAGLSSRELPPLWDVDVPADLDRLEREGFADLLA